MEINVGNRNNEMYKLVSEGKNKLEILNMNKKYCKPPLQKKEIINLIKSNNRRSV